MLQVLDARAATKVGGRRRVAPARLDGHHRGIGSIDQAVEQRILTRWSRLVHAASARRFAWARSDEDSKPRVPDTAIVGVLLLVNPDRSPVVYHCTELALRRLLKVVARGDHRATGSAIDWLTLDGERARERPKTWLTDKEVRQAATMAMALACDARLFVAALFNAAGRRGDDLDAGPVSSPLEPDDPFHCSADDMREAVHRLQQINDTLARQLRDQGRPVVRPREGRWLTPKALRLWSDDVLRAGATNVEHTIISRGLFYEDPTIEGLGSMDDAREALQMRTRLESQTRTGFTQHFVAVAGSDAAGGLPRVRDYCRSVLKVPEHVLRYSLIDEEDLREFLPRYTSVPASAKARAADEERIVILSFDPSPTMPEYYGVSEAEGEKEGARVSMAFVFESAQPLWSNIESRMVRRLPTRHARALESLVAARSRDAFHANPTDAESPILVHAEDSSRTKKRGRAASIPNEKR